MQTLSLIGVQDGVMEAAAADQRFALPDKIYNLTRLSLISRYKYSI